MCRGRWWEASYYLVGVFILQSSKASQRQRSYASTQNEKKGQLEHPTQCVQITIRQTTQDGPPRERQERNNGMFWLHYYALIIKPGKINTAWIRKATDRYHLVWILWCCIPCCETQGDLKLAILSLLAFLLLGLELCTPWFSKMNS